MKSEKCDEKILTFVDLLAEHNVEIPIIQRDYAQGRVENKEILVHFLYALYDSILSEKKIKLDFIYGNIVNGYFQPLDGQQRLTTLFLLHWYAYMKEHIYDTMKENILLNFTYETRISSRDFCNSLVSNNVEIQQTDNSIKEKIIDSNWFFLSWEKDPTIKSMLNAIDEIHRLFKNVEDMWDKLTELKTISFYYVELENIGLTDDLYIKMNARGKLLTPFENFKAELQKKSIEEKWEEEIRPDEKFSFIIDTNWTDFFWEKYRKNFSVDSAHMRFISALVMNRLAIEKYDNRISLIRSLNENSDCISSKLISKSTFLYLIDCYNLYSNMGQDIMDKLEITFPLWRHKPKTSLLSAIVYDDGADSSYTTKVLFFAQTEYLLRNSTFVKENYLNWMRVVRNIVSRGNIDKDGKKVTIIRSPETFIGVINLISELSTGCSNVYKYLDTNSVISTFTKDQIDEERIKANLIVHNPSLKELIWKAEDNELLRGSIRFVFQCIDYKVGNVFNVCLFSKIQSVFESYFNKECDVSPELRRAFLCIEVNGKYEFYDYWWSKWSVNGAIKRKLLDNYGELEYLITSEQREYFKKLIIQLVDKSLIQIPNDFIPPDEMPNWKVRLIKEKNLLDTAKSNYIAIAEDNQSCFLLKSKRPRDIDGSIEIK